MQGRKGPDGVSRYAADAHDLQTYRDAEQQLRALRVPVLVAQEDARARLYVAAFDGTGNDRTEPGLGPKTNVALLHEQLIVDPQAHPQIRSGYVPGPGTQNGWASRILDAATGRSYDARLEEMYLQFCRQAHEWLKADPDARISLANVGFSRGAEQAAGFARLVHERGIRDPSGVELQRGRDGLIREIRYGGALLRPPGEVAQAEMLFDPVGTGTPHRRDRRPPPSVLSGFQLIAEDERRDLFPSSRIIDPGLSADGRFLGVVLGGAHSNTGGGYRDDGLSRRALNLAVDYLNALSDRPFLQKTWLRPDLDVVTRSLEHAPIYDDDHYRANERRKLPEAQRRPAFECIDGRLRSCTAQGRDAEPMDPALDARFRRRAVEPGPVPPMPAEFRHFPPAGERDDLQPQAPPRSPLQQAFGAWAAADAAGDRDAARATLASYLDSPQGRDFIAQVEAGAARMREAEHLAREEAMARQAEQQAPRVRAMVM